MLVTGKPLVVLGIITAPPGPVYPVIVMLPLLVMNVNWACTTEGSARSSRRNRFLMPVFMVPLTLIVPTKGEAVNEKWTHCERDLFRGWTSNHLARLMHEPA